MLAPRSHRDLRRWSLVGLLPLLLVGCEPSGDADATDGASPTPATQDATETPASTTDAPATDDPANLYAEGMGACDAAGSA